MTHFLAKRQNKRIGMQWVGTLIPQKSCGSGSVLEQKPNWAVRSWHNPRHAPPAGAGGIEIQKLNKGALTGAFPWIGNKRNSQELGGEGESSYSGVNKAPFSQQDPTSLDLAATQLLFLPLNCFLLNKSICPAWLLTNRYDFGLIA